MNPSNPVASNRMLPGSGTSTWNAALARSFAEPPLGPPRIVNDPLYTPSGVVME